MTVLSILNSSLPRGSMNLFRPALLAVTAILLATPQIYAQASPSAVKKQLKKFSLLSVDQRPAESIKIAADIIALPAGPKSKKVEFADELAHDVTIGDQGVKARQAVADALSDALKQSPVAAKGDQPAEPYIELAKLVRYMRVTTTLDDPQLTKAEQVLSNNEADVQKADFTLEDMERKKHTLSELRGKIVLVNFWSTASDPSLQEMPDFNIIYDHFKSQDLVVLAITEQNYFEIDRFVAKAGFHFPVLIDANRKVHNLFHVTDVPQTFIYDRKGKMVGECINQCTQKQFLDILDLTDLHN